MVVVNNRLGKALCDRCGKVRWYRSFEPEKRDKQFCDRECRRKYIEKNQSRTIFGEEVTIRVYPFSQNSYGQDWDEVRERILERDGYECQSCGLSQEEHRDQYGQGLHVHHKVPLNDHPSYHDANRESNLVALCCKCHRSEEQENGGIA